MSKVSVIIPVYNGEKYIKRCVDSILHQTYNDLEIIVVNDGSSDNTSNILKMYSKNDKICIINKKNTGVSDSRNEGINIATGDYFFFCDADDWLDKNTIEISMKEINKNDALRFSHYIANNKNCNKKNSDDDVYADIDKVIDNNEIIENLIANRTEGHLWNYLLKADIIKKNKIKFDKDLFYQEDFVFLIKYFLMCKNIKIISKPLYYYYKHENSATSGLNNSKRNLSTIPYLRVKILSILCENNVMKYDGLLEQRFLNLQMMYYTSFVKNLTYKVFKNTIREISSHSRDYYKDVLKMNFISKKWKIFIFLLKNKYVFVFRFYLKLYIKINKI